MKSPLSKAEQFRVFLTGGSRAGSGRVNVMQLDPAGYLDRLSETKPSDHKCTRTRHWTRGNPAGGVGNIYNLPDARLQTG